MNRLNDVTTKLLRVKYLHCFVQFAFIFSCSRFLFFLSFLLHF